MSNELVKKEEQKAKALLSQGVSEEENKDLATLDSGRFIPSLSIAYSMSKSVSDGIARPGEFVYAGKESLGKKIEIIVLDYRFHATHTNKETHAAEKHCYHLRTNPVRLRDDQEYKDFCNSVPTQTHNLKKGADLLCYIVNNGSFGLFFCKASLEKFSNTLYKNSMPGARSQIVTTELAEWKGKKWYNLLMEPTGRAATQSDSTIPGLDKSINIPLDTLVEMKKKFDDPLAGTSVAEEDAFETDR